MDRRGQRCARNRRFLRGRRLLGVRVMACRGRWALIYRGRAHALLLGVLAAAVAVAAGVVVRVAVDALPVALAVAAVPALAWAWYAFRLIRFAPTGSGGPGGPAPPGGAGVREPRRPLPRIPDGAALLPSDDDSLGGVAVLG